jgi:tetratricopeptide (TPR) repeat protein
MVPAVCFRRRMTAPTGFSSHAYHVRAKRRGMMESLMKSLVRFLLVGVAGFALAAPAASQRADDQILPKSVELQHQAREAVAAGKLEQAENLLETALAVDPRNRSAFVDIARVAEKQHLFGKAIRMTNKALLLEPNDAEAIAVQGEAMVELGATARAQANLQKLQAICGAKGCPQVAQLSGAISRGPTVASAKVPESPKSN